MGDTTARRKFLGSPNFVNQNDSSIAVNGYYLIDYNVNGTPAQKYLPFNLITITNQSSQTIRVNVNQRSDQSFIVAGGSIRTIDSKTLPAIRSVLIENVGTNTITSSQITIEVNKEVINPDSMIAGLAQRFIR